LLARAALGELDVDQREIDRGITESPDAGRAMGDEVLMGLPEGRRQVLREAVWAMTIRAIWQSVRQLEHACKQITEDPHQLLSPEMIALVAATPACLSELLFEPPEPD
jgi:hypothetical protein